MLEGEKLPTIEADRIRLRHLEETDADAIFDVFSDPEALRFWSSLPMTERSEAAKLIGEIHEFWHAKTLFQWGIALKPNDSIIGTTTLFHLDEKNRRAEIGYILNRKFWGHGFAKETVSAVLRFAFDELNLHRIEADVDPQNAASIRLLERHGFQKEGYLRERWIIGGKVYDALFYGLLKSDWQASKNS